MKRRQFLSALIGTSVAAKTLPAITCQGACALKHVDLVMRGPGYDRLVKLHFHRICFAGVQSSVVALPWRSEDLVNVEFGIRTGAEKDEVITRRVEKEKEKP